METYLTTADSLTSTPMVTHSPNTENWKSDTDTANLSEMFLNQLYKEKQKAMDAGESTKSDPSYTTIAVPPEDKIQQRIRFNILRHT
jgi:hypothetical protein